MGKTKNNVESLINKNNSSENLILAIHSTLASLLIVRTAQTVDWSKQSVSMVFILICIAN